MTTDTTTQDHDLQVLAGLIDRLLPPGHGFVLLTIPFNQPDPQVAYVSNCRREDAIKTLKEVLFRWGINDEWMKGAE